jgi:hypothetical protein
VKNRIKIQSTGDPKNTKQTHLIERNKESNTAIKITSTADYNNNNAQHSSKQTIVKKSDSRASAVETPLKRKLLTLEPREQRKRRSD